MSKFLFVFESIRSLVGLHPNGTGPRRAPRAERPRFFSNDGDRCWNGFRPWPDTGTYALLTVWKDKESAESALKGASIFQELEARSNGIKNFWLRAHRGKGSWKGDQPFVLDPEPIVGKVAVITRARIKWQWMPYFWLRVRKVSRQLRDISELEFSKGIGEWPLIEQATFSIWTDESAIDSLPTAKSAIEKWCKPPEKQAGILKKCSCASMCLRNRTDRPYRLVEVDQLVVTGLLLFFEQFK